jgi:hypothetical protein
VSPATDEVAAFIGGFVAAEGNFRAVGQRPRFAFAVGLGAADSQSCEALYAFFGVGSIHRRARRREQCDDEVTFQVQGLRDLVDVVVPFMDYHLPPSHKRDQYQRWRQELLTYWDYKARRRRPCSVEGCDAPSRGFGLCRHHYYLAHRR